MFVFHAWALSAMAPFGETEQALGVLAELSIQGFFIVSGALVYGSLERSETLATYAEKRVRRLYPAYAVVILVPALVSGFLTGWADVTAILSYLGANLIFLNFLSPDLPGLFDANRFTEVNGALWTLKIEVMFYIGLPVLAVL
ncbi:MAG: acyltransferase family protein, partial [Henriciella sp.]